MTESEIRQKVVTTAKKYLGCKESGGTVTVIGSGRARIVATDESGNTETWTVKE